MRIISGIHKKQKIIAPKFLPIRPTMDFAKEGLFNILNNQFDFDSLYVLDLYAGTGNISYEFGSRGASHIISVDKNHNCVKFIKKTTKELSLDIVTIKTDCLSFIASTKYKFNMIFADPPYNQAKSLFYELPRIVFNKNLLKENGMLIVEHSRDINFEHESNFIFYKKYGSCLFSFFE